MQSITVTQEDITEAMRRLYANTYTSIDKRHDCPIACALERTLDLDRSEILVGPDYITIGTEDYCSLSASYLDISPSMRQYMHRWDYHYKASPHTFRLS